MKYIKRIIATCSILLFTPIHSMDVHFAGVSYLGSAGYIENNFHYTSQINIVTDGVSTLDKAFSAKVPLQKYKFNFIVDALADYKNEDNLSFTFAIQNEVTSVEKIGDLYKILIQLDAQLLFFDFNTMSIVASFPVNIQYNDAIKTEPTEQYILERYQDIYFGKISANLIDRAIIRLTEVKPKRRYKNYIQVVNSSLSDAAWAISPNQESATRGLLSQYFAQSFSQFLSSNQNISVLPFIKGHAIGNKLAGKYANGDVYTLELPESDYAIDMEILAFKRKLFAKEKAGKTYIYAVQALFNFYEPLSGRSYFKQKLFNGASKVVPASQSNLDNWSAYKESSLALFDKFTRQLDKPNKKWLKKHSGSSKGIKSFKNLKEVINKCR